MFRKRMSSAGTPGELTQKEALVTQILELQNTLEDLSQRVESVRDENIRLRSVKTFTCGELFRLFQIRKRSPGKIHRTADGSLSRFSLFNVEVKELNIALSSSFSFTLSFFYLCLLSIVLTIPCHF